MNRRQGIEVSRWKYTIQLGERGFKYHTHDRRGQCKICGCSAGIYLRISRRILWCHRRGTKFRVNQKQSDWHWKRRMVLEYGK